MIPAWTLLLISAPKDLRALAQTPQTKICSSCAGPQRSLQRSAHTASGYKKPPQPFPTNKPWEPSPGTAFLPSSKSLGSAVSVPNLLQIIPFLSWPWVELPPAGLVSHWLNLAAGFFSLTPGLFPFASQAHTYLLLPASRHACRLCQDILHPDSRVSC